jgi:hypothetical protein
MTESKATERPWRIVPEAPHLIFGREHGKAIATVYPDRSSPPMKGYIGDQLMMSDEEYADSERDEWAEERRLEREANAELIVTAVNERDSLREALIGMRNDLGCWCKTPMVNASEGRDHEPRCIAARAALRKEG